MLGRPIQLFRNALNGYWNIYLEGRGEISTLKTHSQEECALEECDIHNRPKEFEGFRLQWRQDRGLLEQVCEHGVAHPAPSEVAYSLKIGRDRNHLTHGCCSGLCCLEWAHD